MFVVIVACQLLVAAVSIDLLSSVRAYVTGESLYSKGQKDAQIALLDYAEFHRETDYQHVLQALAVPLGDRAAREALQKADPDLGAAKQGFIDGGNHPDDIAGLIRMFRLFHEVSFMADAIATWTEGDRVIEQMRALAGRAHEHVVAGDLNATEVSEMRQQAPRLNKHLTELERTFSAQLGHASRLTQRLLLALNLTLAVLLGLTGLGFVLWSSKVQAATEDEVRRRQESLQRLLDSAAEGLYGVDMQGRCTFINRAALEMLGYADESAVIGRDIHALIHHSYADGSPYPASESRIYQAYRELEELHVTDEVFWRRDGTSFPVEYWSHPVLKDGRIQGAVATFFDITERLQMQTMLREGEVRIAKLVDAVTDGVITIDASRRIVLFNRAAERLFGVSAAQAIGGGVERFIPLRLRGTGTDPGTRDVMADGGAGAAAGSVHDLTGRRSNGQEFPLEATLSRLETERGTLTTVVLRDVSELLAVRAERQSREALEAANRAKTEFLSRMSHELRTPLNAVLGFSQLLRLDAVRPPTKRQLERIRHIETAGAHLLALVNDVLDLSRVDSGQLRLTLEAVALKSVTEDAIAMVSPLAAQAGVSLRSAEPTLAWVRADRLRLRQVLVNLLSNAVKYNRRGGSVRVSWSVEVDHCRLQIADNGLGMTDDKLARLFEPFNRLGAEKSKVEGTGIGLVLSRRLVDLMDGELTVDSAVGEGTIASVVLLTAARPPAAPPLPSPPSQHGALDDTLRVLYAEDTEVNVELVRQVFTLRPAIELGIAESGASALKMARADPPDLMLVDMNLGDMTGIELARELRANPVTAGIRLVALSADALPEQIGAALAFGFESYLTKPVDFRQLLDVLDGRVTA
ncbi:MAG: PAS domain S-box protein [Caldimonas sp.]